MVDSSLASVSDSAYTFSIVIYTLAVAAFAFEYAFGRTGRIARTSTAHRAALEGGISLATEVTTGVSRAERLGRAGLAATVLGAVLQIVSLALRAAATGRVPWGNMFEFACAVVLVVVLSWLWLVRSAPQLRHLGIFVLIPVVSILVYAGLELYAAAAPLVPALRSYWLVIHVISAVIASGMFLFSGLLAGLYLVRHRYDRSLVDDRPASRPVTALAPRLPTAAVLDSLSYRVVAFAFPIWTFAVMAGAIWAESAWGRFWGWDPKETWALIAWLVYAGYLHARATAGWKGTKAASVNLVGAFAMTFNFLIINLVVSGLHSYAGLT